MSRHRRRIAQLVAEVDAIPPDPETVDAARDAVVRRVLARQEAATDPSVEVPPRDPLAEAIVLQAARAQGIPVDDPDHVAELRARLVDDLARYLER